MLKLHNSYFRYCGNVYTVYKERTLSIYECEKQAEQAAVLTKAFFLAYIEDSELRENIYDIVDNLVSAIKHLVLKCHGSIKRARGKLLDETCRWAVKRRIKRIAHQLYRTIPLSVRDVFTLELSELMLEYAFAFKHYNQSCMDVPAYIESNPL